MEKTELMEKMVQKEKNGDPGEDGTNGKDGINGQDGKDGYTPIKGTDYFTNAEIEEIEQDILGQVSSTPQVFYWDGSTDSTGLAFWNEVYQEQKKHPCIVIHTKLIMGSYITFTWNYNNNMPTSVFANVNSNIFSRVTSTVSQSTGFSNLDIYWVSVYFTITNDTVTKINANSGISTASFLSTKDDYYQIYTPLYNGSPTTKKYVDDSIANAITNAIGGEY